MQVFRNFFPKRPEAAPARPPAPQAAAQPPAQTAAHAPMVPPRSQRPASEPVYNAANLDATQRAELRWHMGNLRNPASHLDKSLEGNAPFGLVPLTPRQSAHKALHEHMRKQEESYDLRGTFTGREHALSSREADGKLYPNHERLARGDERTIQYPGRYPDGTREMSHYHDSPGIVPDLPSHKDRARAFQDRTNANHGPNTSIEENMMIDARTGKTFVYDGQVIHNKDTGEKFSPFLETYDPYQPKIPPGRDVFRQGVEIPKADPAAMPAYPPKAHLEGPPLPGGQIPFDPSGNLPPKDEFGRARGLPPLLRDL